MIRSRACPESVWILPVGFATVDMQGVLYPDIRTVNGVADTRDLRFALDRQRT
jgi:hypothetical protein